MAEPAHVGKQAAVQMGERRVFLREATGLVREMRWYDALFLNFLNMSIGLGAAWVIFFGPGIYPGASITLGLVLAAVGCLFGMYCWAALTSAMPRSGGDYVFVSRALHPSLGFATNWMWVFWNVVWCAVLGTWVVTWGLRDLVGMLGVVYNDAGYLSWATTLSQPNNPITFTITAFVIILSGVMLALGLKVYLRIQAVCALVGLVMLVVAMAVFATTSNGQFISIWNTYAAQQVQRGAVDYATTVAAAPDYLAYVAPPRSELPSLTLGILPVGFWVLAYPYFSAFLGGELKRAKSTALIGNIGGVVIGALFIVVLWVLTAGTVGETFISGTYAQYYGYSSTAYGMPSQWFDFYAGIISGNPIIIYLMGIGMIGWLLMYPALSFLGQTRAALAWSFDRLVPAWFGKVSDRWHTPINAIIFFTILDLAYLFFYAQTFTYQQSFTAVLGQALATFLFIGLAAIVLPYRKHTKPIYEVSGMTRKIAGIPLVTIAGVVWVIFLLVNIYYFFIDPELGATDAYSKTGIKYFSVYMTAGVWIAGFALFWIARAYRKAQGINIDLAYKELPPE